MSTLPATRGREHNGPILNLQLTRRIHPLGSRTERWEKLRLSYNIPNRNDCSLNQLLAQNVMIVLVRVWYLNKKKHPHRRFEGHPFFQSSHRRSFQWAIISFPFQIVLYVAHTRINDGKAYVIASGHRKSIND